MENQQYVTEKLILHILNTQDNIRLASGCFAEDIKSISYLCPLSLIYLALKDDHLIEPNDVLRFFGEDWSEQFINGWDGFLDHGPAYDLGKELSISLAHITYPWFGRKDTNT